MFRKLLTSFNWVVGTVAIVIALSSGLLPGTGGAEVHKTAIETIVWNIAKLEQGRPGGLVTSPRNNLEFQKRLSGLALGSDDYVFEAFYEDNKEGYRDFVIRATTSDDAVKKRRAPPLIYRYIIPGNGSIARKEWVKLSGKKYGLGLF